MLLNLALLLLLSAICAISAKIVEIDCIDADVACYVNELPEELPANATWKFLCPQNCTTIRIPNANLPRFPRELWITNSQVTTLELSGTDFEELAFGDFFHASKLTTFELIYNKKPLSLRDNCFWGAFELNWLVLFNNKISELEGDAFNGIPRLEQLSMQSNEISHISNDHFRNLPNLSSIVLFFNSIGTIESEAFLHNPKLNSINIDWNSIHELDLLLPFTNPGQITVYDNQLTKFAYRSISQDFEEFSKGTSFKLENNELTELYIQPNFSVETLILSLNPIERIDKLPVLRSLKELKLQYCKIKSLDGQRFADKYVNLERLHLTGNILTSFSKETFAGLDKLGILTLDTNELKEVDFPRLVSLTTLDLKDNSLTEFPYGEDIRNTFPALKELDIRYNDFDEEYLAELVKVIQDQGITVIG